MSVVDKNGKVLKNGDILHSSKPVNREHEFVIMCLTTKDVRYGCDLDVSYEYRVEDLYLDSEVTGNLYEIMGDLAKNLKCGVL